VSRITNVLRSLRQQPAYTLMRGVARFGAVRRAVADTRSALQRSTASTFLRECEARLPQSTFQGIDRFELVRRLREDGAAFGLRIPPETVTEILRWSEATPCYADREPQHGFRLADRGQAEQHLGKPILLAQHFNAGVECAAIQRLAQDPLLQWIAATYLESMPTFVGANLWWTFPVQALESDRHRHAHLFHRDVDDFRFFKFFFYLTDVEAGEGAHVCVLASHHNPPMVRRGDRWNIRRYSDEEIAGHYPAPQIVEICGPAGTGFAENTMCVHKGLTPVRHPRLLLQLQFALFDYGVMHDRRDATELKRIA